MSSLDHRYLRSAIEFAVMIADAGQRRRPPLAFPAALKPYLKQQRVPGSELGKLRRAIEADDAFRRGLATAAVPELVDDIGREWLQRHDGWEARIAELVAQVDAATEDAGAASALRRAEKRREAAEQVAVRTRAELVQLQARVDDLETRLAAERERLAASATELARAKREVTDAKLAARHANDRAEGARERLGAAEAERDDARRATRDAEARRDALLVERAERAGVAVSAAQLAELPKLARSARTLADRLGALVATEELTRTPLALPGGAARDSARATEHLLRAPGARILVDGYNVAKLAWPDEALAVQRARLLDLLDDVVRRFGSDITVVFDGAEVVGSHARRRHLLRVTYSAPGVTADDDIRAEVAGTPADRPVVVVTNDRAIRRDVAAAGANLVTSDAFVAVARR